MFKDGNHSAPSVLQGVLQLTTNIHNVKIQYKSKEKR